MTADRKPKGPWFLHTFANPPTDPLTIQLMLLAEDMTPILGPQTVGPGHYCQVVNAFIEQGWAGFEEAFDAVVPRSRPDYAEVKRNLLREPVFMLRVHRNHGKDAP